MRVCYEHDASILRALGEQVTSMMRACHGIDETILRARCKHVTGTMQASHKHLASMLQAQCKNITSVMQACIEHVMTLEYEHDASMLYERANKDNARRNRLKSTKVKVTAVVVQV